MQEYCRELIEIAGKFGGFVLCPGAQPENPWLDTFWAMVEAINKYGSYNLISLINYVTYSLGLYLGMKKWLRLTALMI